MTKEKLFTASLVAVTGAAVLVTGILFGQSFLRMLPLFISLFVMLLQSKVNRYGFLLGGLNSLLYAAVYYYYGLYATAAYAVVFSFTLQVITFFRWKKRSYGKSTVFRKMTWWQRLLGAAGFAAVWFGLVKVLSLFPEANYSLLDSAHSLLGATVTVLTLFAFIEYIGLQILSGVISVALYVTMLGEKPEQITYLIYAVYALICCVRAAVRIRKLYSEQQNKHIENGGTSNESESDRGTEGDPEQPGGTA